MSETTRHTEAPARVLVASATKHGSTAIFGGLIDPAKLRFPLNRLPASDFRDWSAIRACANEVASSIVGRRASAA